LSAVGLEKKEGKRQAPSNKLEERASIRCRDPGGRFSKARDTKKTMASRCTNTRGGADGGKKGGRPGKTTGGGTNEPQTRQGHASRAHQQKIEANLSRWWKGRTSRKAGGGQKRCHTSQGRRKGGPADSKKGGGKREKHPLDEGEGPSGATTKTHFYLNRTWDQRKKKIRGRGGRTLMGTIKGNVGDMLPENNLTAMAGGSKKNGPDITIAGGKG